MKITKTFLLLFSLLLIVNLAISIKIKSIDSRAYSRTECPEIIKEMFMAVKKPDESASQLYNKCIEEMVKNNHDLLQKFWDDKIKEQMCDRGETILLSSFSDLVKVSETKVSENNLNLSCADPVIKNLKSVYEVESDYIQNKIRQPALNLYQCPIRKIAKDVITAFTDIHRGSAETNLFRKLNGYDK